jgi:hypothetical protein
MDGIMFILFCMATFSLGLVILSGYQSIPDNKKKYFWMIWCGFFALWFLVVIIYFNSMFWFPKNHPILYFYALCFIYDFICFLYYLEEK